MEDWAKIIRDARKEKGWTQTELARKMRVSTNSIMKWGRKRKNEGIGKGNQHEEMEIGVS